MIRFCRSLGCEGLSDFKLRLGDESLAALPQDTAAGLDETRPDPAPALAPTLAQSAGLGISAAGALARLTSHSR